MWCFINGDIRPWTDCRIHISDLGLQRGYGIFDYFRAVNGVVQWKEDYYARLWQSIEKSYLDLRMKPDDLDDICSRLQDRNQLNMSAFKVIVTGGESEDMGQYQGPPAMVVIQRPFEPPAQKYFTEGAALISYPYQRPEPEIKNLNYYFSTRLHRQLKEKDAVDVLFCTDKITETSRSNFFGIKDGIIHTPSDGILEGITRKQVLQLSSKGFTFHKRQIPTSELFSFEEIFITGTTKDVMPIVRIDDRLIGNGKPGKMTKEVMRLFSMQRQSETVPI